MAEEPNREDQQLDATDGAVLGEETPGDVSGGLSVQRPPSGTVKVRNARCMSCGKDFLVNENDRIAKRAKCTHCGSTGFYYVYGDPDLPEQDHLKDALF